MARYLLVQVDDDGKATALLSKLNGVRGVRVIGVFARPTEFCEDSSHRDPNESSIRGGKTHLWHCRICKKPKKLTHTPKNLIDPPDLPIEFRDIFLNIREPYEPPIKKYGKGAIERSKSRTRDVTKKLERARDPDVQARRLAARERRKARKVRKINPRREQ